MQAGSVGACTPVESTSLTDPARLTDPLSIDVRGLALAVVTMIVVVFPLKWAEKFFIPLLLGIIIVYTLNPLMVWPER
jgi:predicted PurR-regulated permease PerM